MLDRKLFKCYDLRFMLFAVVAAAVMIGSALIARIFERGSAPRLALGVVEGLAYAAIIVGTIRAINRLDELQHRIHLEAQAFAFAATAGLVSAWAFLEKAGLPPLAWSEMVWPIMVAFWAVGLLVVRRRYR